MGTNDGSSDGGEVSSFTTDSGSLSSSGVTDKKVLAEAGLLLACINCDYTTARRDHLRRHTEAIHLGLKFPCDLCTYVATQGDKLARHKRTQH